MAAAVHAGWRGLAAGVIEATVTALPVDPAQLMAWLGPAIGPRAYEVDAAVRDPFVAHDPASSALFREVRSGHWLADLPGLTRQRLAACGVSDLHGGELCTFEDPTRFFSYRRDRVTGRMASLIWLEG